MKNLNEIRMQINEIDKAIVRLYEQRMSLVKEVIECKKENNLPIFDASREDEVIRRNTLFILNRELIPFYTEFQKDLMKNSRNYQEYILNKKDDQ